MILKVQHIGMLDAADGQNTSADGAPQSANEGAKGGIPKGSMAVFRSR